MKISQSSWEAARTAVAAAATAVARTRDPSSPFLAITPRSSSSGKQASERGLALSTIDGAAFVRIFIAVAVPYMHSAFGGRRRSLSAAMPFITDLLSQLSVSRGSKGGGGLAAINQIGNGQTL